MFQQEQNGDNQISSTPSTTFLLIISIGLFVLAVIPRLYKLDYFLMVDENLWQARSVEFLRGLANNNLIQTVQTGHPGVTTMWSGTLGLWLQYFSTTFANESITTFANKDIVSTANLKSFELMRLPLVLFSALSVSLVFLLAQQLFGWQTALLGAGLMAFEPFFIAHTRVLHHDAAYAEFSVLAVLSWLLYTKQKQKRYFLMASIAIALASLSKISGLFLLGFIGLTIVWDVGIQKSKLTPQLNASFFIKIKRMLIVWAQLVVISLLVAFLVWPALWIAPSTVLNTIIEFITHESGDHARGSFFMGQPIPNPGFLFYPLGLVLRLSPFSSGGALLALISLGFFWFNYYGYGVKKYQTKLFKDKYVWLTWLFGYVGLFTIFMALIAKKQERYILPVSITLNILAGWGWVWLIIHFEKYVRYKITIKAKFITLAKWLVVIFIIGGQFALAWSYAPYYATFYNPLVGGGSTAHKLVLVGRGEGLEQATNYVLDDALSSLPNTIPKIATWYATVVRSLAVNKAIVQDIAHPHHILQSNYVFFYINQLQRQLPDMATINYVQQHLPLINTIKLANLDYVYIYQGPAISHPIDTYAPPNRLVDKVYLAGFDLPQGATAGTKIPLRLFWLNAGRQADEYFYVRLVDDLAQDWGWGSCQVATEFKQLTWAEGAILESDCELVIYPGTPPDNYLLKVGLLNKQNTVIGQMNLAATEGTISVSPAVDFPSNEWVTTENQVEYAFNDDLQLIGYNYNPLTLKPSQALFLTFFWRARQYITQDYSLRLTAQGSGKGQFAEWENKPVNGRYPTVGWRPDELVRDPAQFNLPPYLPSGTYQIFLSVLDEERRETARFQLPDLQVEGRDHVFELITPPTNPQVAQLGEKIAFVGYTLGGAITSSHLSITQQESLSQKEGETVSNITLLRGNELVVTLNWQAKGLSNKNYTVFTQLLDQNNQVKAQHDSQPNNGNLPTTTWAKGEYIADVHSLAIPTDLAEGVYRLIVGMYLPDSGERLPVFNQDGQLIGDYLTLDTPLFITEKNKKD